MGSIALVFPLLMILYKNYYYITIMRALLGLSVGFSSALCSLYANSLVRDEIKGRVGSIFQLSVTLFIFLAQLMNYFFVDEFDVTNCKPLTDLSWKIQLGLSSIIGLAVVITLIFAPEMRPVVEKKGTATSRASESLFSKKNARWVFFALMLAVMNQLTGINGVMYYAAQILASAGIQNVLLTQLLVVGLWNMLTVFIFMAIVDKLSRKKIFTIALAIMIAGTIALIIRSVRHPVLISSFMVQGLSVVAMAGMIFYLLGFETGPGPLFYVMATQDFPPHLVNQGLSLSNILLYVLNIALSLSFPMITEAIGAGFTFVILCGFEVVCLLYFGFYSTEKYDSPSLLSPLGNRSLSRENHLYHRLLHLLLPCSHLLFFPMKRTRFAIRASAFTVRCE